MRLKEPDMQIQQHIAQYGKADFTIIVCEACFDVLFEDDAEYYHDKYYCYHCLEEVQL